MNDYSRCPSRIQFLEQRILPDNYRRELTVDYDSKMITFSVVDSMNRTATSKCKSFPRDVTEMLKLSAYENFIDWIYCEPDMMLSNGYRDGWYLVCYLTPQNDDHSIVYPMTQHCKDDPFEILLSWLKAFAPEIVPDW